MPNWCSNKMIVSGKNLDKFMDFISGKDDKGENLPFDFEKIVATPKELLDTPSPIQDTVVAKANKDKFGVSDWYEWRLLNWGTKWNLAADSISVEKYDDRNEFSFDTAWNPPKPIVEKLSVLFPELTFALRYIEPYMDFAGDFIYRNGEKEDNTYKNGDWKYTEIAEEFGFGEWLEENNA